MLRRTRFNINTRSRARGRIGVVAATTMWGLNTGILSRYGRGLPVSAAAVSAGGAVFLLTASWLRRSPTSNATITDRVWVGLLEAVNIVFFVVSLGLASVGTAVALHLCAPVMLTCKDLIKRDASVDSSILLDLTLLISSLALLASEPSGGVSNTLLGCGCALISAGAVAALILRINRRSAQVSPIKEAGLQLAFAATISAFCSVGHLQPPSTFVVLVLSGALLLAPGFALYWHFAPLLRPATAAVLGLNEVVVATAVSALAFGVAIGWRQAASTLLILCVVARRASKGPESSTGDINSVESRES